VILLTVLLLACGSSKPRVEYVEAQQGIVILPVSQIADVEGPTAIRLGGPDPRLPVWLHASEELDFHAIATRCHRGRCGVRYEPDDDRFVCSCTDEEFRPDGSAVERRKPPLVTYPIDYRNETILIDLSPAR